MGSTVTCGSRKTCRGGVDLRGLPSAGVNDGALVVDVGTAADTGLMRAVEASL
jgi:hypothetical protein